MNILAVICQANQSEVLILFSLFYSSGHTHRILLFEAVAGQAGSRAAVDYQLADIHER